LRKKRLDQSYGFETPFDQIITLHKTNKKQTNTLTRSKKKRRRQENKKHEP